MIYKNNAIKYRSLVVGTICTLLAAFSCSSCHEKDDPITPEPVPTHTFLIYMMGDNSLSDYCRPNVTLLKEGLTKSTEDINLVIYKDNRDSGDALPSLFQLKRTFDKKTNTTKIDTVMIKKWDAELNSCDPEVFKDVVKTTFSTFNTEVKGVELWSHGMSWLPSSSATKSTRYIGQDDFKFFELWSIREALEECPHLDYILFDCCYVGMAEVALEFDKVADYVFGPITEIMGSGFPYNSMLPIIASCQNKASVRGMLEDCVKDFTTCGFFIGNGYSVTLLETAKAEAMAKALARLRNAVPERIAALGNNSRALEQTMQHYGRSVVGTRYHFYEFRDYVKYLADGGAADIQAIAKEIDENDIVVKFASTAEFSEGWETISLMRCKGLGVTIPEFFWLMGDEKRLTDFYGKTKWGKALGF